jgi:type III secretion system YscD/HrpQ family protein
MKSLVLKLGRGWRRGGRRVAAGGEPPLASNPSNAPNAPNAPNAQNAQNATHAAASSSNADASAALAPRAWLHIRSGLHRGGAVALHDGRYRIGASLDDDVVLRDVQMLADHLHIDVDAQGIYVTAQAAGWRHDQAVVEPRMTLDMPCKSWLGPRHLRLGDTHLEFTWGPLAAAVPAQASAASSELTAPWWLAAARQFGSAGKPVQLAVGFMVAAGLLASFSFIAMGSRPTPSRAAPAGRDALQAAQQRLGGRAEWQHVVVQRVPALGVELRGSVERRDDLNSLLRLPEVAALLPLVRVVVGQDLRRQIQDLAGDPAIQVEIGPAPEPALSAPSSPAQSTTDSAANTANAGNAANAANAANTANAANASATTRAATAARQRVVVTGKTKRPDMAASLQMLNIEFGGRIEIVDRTVYENSTGSEKKLRTELPFTIASVNTGEGYIESTDGARYFEGSVVSGYRVESIERENVVFSVNGKRINFPLN